MTPTVTGAGVDLVEVSKIFKSGVKAVDSVSMAIEPGEFVTFLGPSGSGKTTTLNVIAGFSRPTSGQVRLGGVDVVGMPTHRRNLGMVFQSYALFPHMTVRANVAFGLERRGVGRREIARRADEALEMVRLAGYGDRRPEQLSGGQQQRVALARALVYRPPVLLMDEPLGALDRKLREQLQVEIARLHRELGTTFLFVTHDQEEALALSDRIALFDSGRVVQLGRPIDLYERPVSLFAAEFVGESNVFRGTLDPSGDLVAITGGAVRVPAVTPSAHREVAVVVRPERLTLSAADTGGGSAGASNAVTALVTDISYFGAFRRVGLRYADGGTGTVREDVERESDVSVGQAVTASWPVEHGIVVPVETKEAA
ncbi:ABC transporter ATP-binding protein [Streptosporangium sp. NPDC051022]|uniref:ABC transporter ATP-binding protein n=1 Tax=Streptosporangium sp. NPDC051022 TaxID=3155752 RepID=UPI00341E9228